MNNVNELITLCLTLAFPAYLLKIRIVRGYFIRGKIKIVKSKSVTKIELNERYW